MQRTSLTPEALADILEENARRNARFADPYDPVSGLGAHGPRRQALSPASQAVEYIPESMAADPDFPLARADASAWRRLRCRHDFEYWAATCVTIRDKLSGADVRLRLNHPQRRVLAELERQRMADEPLRLIILKARQWGGSTLVQCYMAWIQLTQRRNWNSLICSHVKDTSATIRGMYAKLLADYPDEIFDVEGVKPEFKVYERSTNIRYIPGRDCRITIASSENQEAVRGGDFAMAHLSEVAFWADGERRTPEGFIRAICGSIMRLPLSLIVLESTANGVGNYFHNEWLRATATDPASRSDKTPIFIPWHGIAIYSAPVADPKALWESMDHYEMGLWEREGCSLEQIEWYRQKRREYPSAAEMAAEYPTTAAEAFANTGSGVFPLGSVESLRAQCSEPEPTKALPQGVIADMASDRRGTLKVWQPPCLEPRRPGRYVVGVDIGGRWRGADYSVIVVLDMMSGPDGRTPEVVAQWRGHCDHDILARRAEAIGRWYDDALLVIESNTMETGPAADMGLSLLADLADSYPNLYHREAFDVETGTPTLKVGFHTNRATKNTVITHLIALVRDQAYIERDATAADELTTFEYKPGGSTGAKAGCHDDLLMARAIALYVGARHVAPRLCRPSNAAIIRRRLPRW